MFKFSLTKGSRRLLLIMAVVALAVVASGYLYFASVNRSEDPRVLSARADFVQYNRLIRDNRFSQALALLDKIEATYRSTPGYGDSFELGVIENNRASVYLVLAETERLSQEQPAADLIKSDLEAAHRHTQAAIEIYQSWLAAHESLDRAQIERRARPFFMVSGDAFAGLNVNKIIAKRVDDIMTAAVEMPRRLSVTYTNLGVIARYQGRGEDARRNYENAIALWPRNQVARNNLNVLLGKPVERPSMLEKLFPPSRKRP